MVAPPSIQLADQARLDIIFGLRLERFNLDGVKANPLPEIGILFPLTSPGASLRAGPLVTTRVIGYGVGLRFIPGLEGTAGLAVTADMGDLFGGSGLREATKIMVYGSMLRF